MFGQDAYTPFVQFLNPKLRYIGSDKSLLTLDTLRDIFALAIHNIKLYRERQQDNFLINPVPKYLVYDKD